ncbi:3-oxoacyl-[acyl-carrier-protein] reductase isoform X1 [Bombina bombina]|uniref:3-oxoacyl-[acyl-carrier-protein] reductase isoform X1 n=1 Tax=Bombina bombina TaxID=8345 RepID=UPI00235AF2B2|nr:3-oxoacyl-[acyl-carrier-protein] reductase isoform X1 [Bombina bombina]
MAKVCAVFGGSRGIGKAIANLLSQKNYKVAIISRNLEVARATAQEVAAPLAISCDISKEHEVQNAFKEIAQNLGHVRYLVNAAGISRDGLLLRTNSEDILSQMSINLLGSIQTCKVAIRGMMQHGGAIVNIGSIVGHKGNIGQSIYSASKEGLVGFSKSLAKELGKKNIRVNVVAPGFIHTEMTSSLDEESLNKMIPLGRFGEADEVAKSVAFLLESPYITGHVLVVDGGLQLQI